MAFHGILHEAIGPLLFPWAPALFGFALWHGLGIGVLILGSLVWAGTLELVRFPVVPACVVTGCLAVTVIVFIVVTHGQFHFFALCLAIAAAVTAIFYRKSSLSLASDA
jgi:hypothetical protein